MPLQNTTPVPNGFFTLLPTLTNSELRVLLLVIRQTHGWYNPKSKTRKSRDRMTHSYIIKRTGVNRRCLSKTIQSLTNKQLLKITDYEGKHLDTPQQRKGKHSLYYQFQPMQNSNIASAQTGIRPMADSALYKRNTQKKFFQKKAVTIDHLLEELKRRVNNKEA